MTYNYEKEKKQLDTKMLASITSTAQSLLDTAGAFTKSRQERCHPLWWLMNCRNSLLTIRI